MSANYSFYAFTLTSNGPTNVAASYQVALDGNDQYEAVATTMHPSDSTPLGFLAAESAYQLQAGPAQISAGMTVATTRGAISGTVTVSTPLNVNLLLTCYGATGVIGSVELSPGALEVPFNFALTAMEAISGPGALFLTEKVGLPRNV